MTLPEITEDMLPARFRDYIISQAQRACVPIGAVAISVVGGFSGLFGNLLRVRLGQRPLITPNIFTLLVGETGSGKSPALDPFIHKMAIIQQRERSRYRSAQQMYKEELSALTEQHKANKTPKKEANIAEKKLYNKIFKGISYQDFYCSDATIASIGQGCAERPLDHKEALDIESSYGNAFVMSGEMAPFFREFTSVGKDSNRSFIVNGYDTCPLYIIKRKMRDAKIPEINNLTLSCLGGIQEDVFRHFSYNFSKNEYGDGLFSRFQMLYKIKKEKEIRNIHPEYLYSTHEMNTHEKTFSDFLERIIEKRNEQWAYPLYKRESWVYTADVEAEDLLLTYQRALLKIEGNSRLVREHLPKTNVFAMKLATLFAAFEEEDPFTASFVTRKHVEMAIKWIDIILHHVCSIYEENDTQIEACHDEIFSRMVSSPTFLKNTSLSGMTARDVMRTNWSVLPKTNKMVNVEAISQYLERLCYEGKLVKRESPFSVKGGRPTSHYHFHPNLHPKTVPLPKELRDVILFAPQCEGQERHRFLLWKKLIDPYWRDNFSTRNVEALLLYLWKLEEGGDFVEDILFDKKTFMIRLSRKGEERLEPYLAEKEMT